ncbi:MAG TPA: hypothetical protein VFE42_31420 [Chloroflexota bacterium]|nr:hypothetical protein [Chloroflexota bacterium]
MTTNTRYSYTRTPRVIWGWGALTLGGMLLPLTNMALLARGYRLSGESIGKNARAAALGAGIIASPWLTAHELGADALVIRQGLNFSGTIDYRNIAAVYATERKPTHFPIALYRHTLFVALWPANLVAIRLRRPQRFRLFHVLPVWKVREVVINVDRREAFIADLRARVAAAQVHDV